MATERILNLGLVLPAYGGNGGVSSQHPDVMMWVLRVIDAAKKDPRIAPGIWIRVYNDTPITMVRNKAVLEAREEGVDVLIMVDSDQRPDCELEEDREAKPFFETSFDFLYRNWDKGPHVVCAPYCGPPPHECVYVFDWVTDESQGQNIPHKLEMIPRERAAVLTGIQNCAAQPTGLIMFDMRAFDLTDPVHQHKALLERGFTRAEAKLVARPWFYYEFRSCYEAEKCSTEDVTATRDMSLAGIEKLGYNPIFCNWNAWAGHHKPKCVRKPRVIFADQIGDKYRMAVKDNLNSRLRRRMVDFPQPEEKPKPVFIREELDPLQKFLQESNGVIRKWTTDDPRLGTNGSVHTEHGDPLADRSARKDNLLRYPPMFTPAGDLHAVEQLAKVVGSRTSNPLFVEVGSWVGETALAMNRGCPYAQIHCVDHWMGSPSDLTSAMAVRFGRKDVLETFLKNTHGTSIRALVGSSKDAASEWKEPAHLVFIDAEHTYEALKSDIEAWWPHLADGGVMAFHDYHDAQFPGVTRAIDERFGSAVTHEYPSTVCWVVKNAETTRTGEGGAAQAREGVQGHPDGREGHSEPSGTGAVLRGAVQGEGGSREGRADVVGSVR